MFDNKTAKFIFYQSWLVGFFFRVINYKMVLCGGLKNGRFKLATSPSYVHKSKINQKCTNFQSNASFCRYFTHLPNIKREKEKKACARDKKLNSNVC